MLVNNAAKIAPRHELASPRSNAPKEIGKDFIAAPHNIVSGIAPMLNAPYIKIGELEAPLYWAKEESGQLADAVQAYFHAALGEKPIPNPQLALVIDYLQYVIAAPCWSSNPYYDNAARETLKELQERSLTLASVESVKRWIEEALAFGIDPL